ncbi:hypothetical protein [Actinoplanes subglobosus]|uniref:Uncharacterized protein n=1 Tax=Actinoplanes subglobosus TaxID=1547892 RepID=A0ABV8J8E7_9ACTN
MHRYVWAALVLLTVSAGVIVLNDDGDPQDVRGQIMTRMRSTLEQADPATHQHAGHTAAAGRSEIVCGVRVYGYEPAEAAVFADVRTVYGFHMCGVAEPLVPWDVAVKLAGPLILDLSTDPAGIQVVEATADIRFVDRLQQMFPARYAELALTEALSETEMTDLRGRYDTAAGL